MIDINCFSQQNGWENSMYYVSFETLPFAFPFRLGQVGDLLTISTGNCQLNLKDSVTVYTP